MVTADSFSSYDLLATNSPRPRQPVCGPEWDMLSNYLMENLPKPIRGQQRQIFIEPRIESGFPDAVVVYWNRAVTKTWKPERTNLKAMDLKVLHYLSGVESESEITLHRFFSKKVVNSLDRLLEANAIYERGGKWKARSLKRNFALKRLIAIEAKVSDWRKGIRQATLNQWFSCESCLLIPRIPSNSPVQVEAKRKNIRVLTFEGASSHQLRSSAEICTPKSYATWLFNEWAWRSSF